MPICEASSPNALSFQKLTHTGDPPARAAIRETAEYLAPGIGNILASLNLEHVIVDGELTKAWDILGDVKSDNRRRGIFGLELEQVKIIPSPMKEKPSLVGAISLALSGHFAAPVFH